ncbi:SagB-type dehydrogenase domain-containing protein [Actinopolyspora erythraea]|uniref:SagB-type dehydrogenase domain-containing protein n=1 Tax=Actinopolyspora erythraea TaxID=414996 RepID=A0A223RWM7_9ACTN|nr:SagB family peptide dehydrogenase [Actinopolyspora erythraea]ASU80286.1 SagB-type dehydrogenase domain-containing protein [Actinopolyspora erythraea]
MRQQVHTRSPERLRLWSLREDTLVEDYETDADSLVVFTRWGEVRIPNPGTPVKEWLHRMSLGPVALENMLSLRTMNGSRQRGGAPEDDPNYTELMRVLDLLSGSVVHSLAIDDCSGPLLSAVPITHDASFELPRMGKRDEFRLSRFAALRPYQGAMVLESPLARYRVVLHRPRVVAAIGMLARSVDISELASGADFDETTVRQLVGHLVAAGMVVVGTRIPASAEPVFAEDSDTGLTPWSHHDLLFHSRSGAGHDDAALGAVFEHSDLPSPPAVPARPHGRRFRLSRPSLERLAAHDASLTATMEQAKSYRCFGSAPVSVDQLGELLYRCARVRSVWTLAGPGGEQYESTDRPYPVMGGAHALELYLTLDRCSGLPRGIYHYDPSDHSVTLIETPGERMGNLLDSARMSGGMAQRPSALITMTVRILRLSWLYSGIAYAMALKQVGLLQQTLHLVTTAMRLAPCALVSSDGAVAAEAFRLNWPAEVSVGEFVLGTLPDERTTAVA